MFYYWLCMAFCYVFASAGVFWAYLDGSCIKMDLRTDRFLAFIGVDDIESKGNNDHETSHLTWATLGTHNSGNEINTQYALTSTYVKFSYSRSCYVLVCAVQLDPPSCDSIPKYHNAATISPSRVTASVFLIPHLYQPSSHIHRIPVVLLIRDTPSRSAHQAFNLNKVSSRRVRGSKRNSLNQLPERLPQARASLFK